MQIETTGVKIHGFLHSKALVTVNQNARDFYLVASDNDQLVSIRMDRDELRVFARQLLEISGAKNISFVYA